MKFALLLVFAGISLVAYNQQFAYLEKIELKKEKDYTGHEKDVIKATDYLLSHPIDQNDEDRFYCGKFVVEYAMGSPTITLTLDNLIMDLVGDENQNLLGLYIGIWLTEAIENPEKTEAYYLEHVFTELGKYCANAKNNVASSKIVKKLIEAQKNGTVSEWIEQNRKVE